MLGLMMIDSTWRFPRRLPWQPPLLVACLSLALASEPLFQPDVFDEFGPAQLARAVWLRFVANLVVSLALLAAIAWTRGLPARGAWIESARGIVAVCGAAALANLGLAIATDGIASVAWLPYATAETARWAVLGIFLSLVDSFRRRRLLASAQAREMIVAEAALRAQTELAQTRLLEAQIEPHFLFNTIANLRRTWNVDAALGLRMHDNLLRYLQAALPQMRASQGTLGQEVELVRAYLELFSLRMGARLSYTIEVPEPLTAQAFPRMMLITLVENAIKHGLMPSDDGGTVCIEAVAEGGQLQVSVSDNGVGFGAADTGGSGVGLANIRARLATQYRGEARLSVESLALPPDGRGVRASIRIPCAAAPDLPLASEPVPVPAPSPAWQA